MLDGPRIAPTSGKADALVVFLHGYGADGNDLIDLGRVWAPQLPGTAFASPHAPYPCDELPSGRQWFPLALGFDRFAGAAAAVAPELDRFLDAELARYGLAGNRLALVGFSQGTMMALYVGPRRMHPIAGIVGYSGLLLDPERIVVEKRQTPPILLVHGDADEMIPVMALPAAANGLGKAGFEVEWHMRPGLGHGIDPEGLELGGAFLTRVLGKGTPRP